MLICKEEISKQIDIAIQKGRAARFNSSSHPSSAGHECPRKLWLDYRNVSFKKIPSRMLRIFETGNIYEARGVSYINDAHGMKVKDQQKEFKDGIARGFIDGIVEFDGPEEDWLLEIKSSKETYFNQIKKHGVKEKKLEHYVQCQIYMHWTGLNKCLYMIINKNTDDIHFEVLDYEKSLAGMYLQRIKSEPLKTEMPDGISDNPTYYLCKLCPHYDFCHFSKAAIPTCRTCKNYVPSEEGGKCGEKKNAIIPIEFQHKIQSGLKNEKGKTCGKFVMDREFMSTDKSLLEVEAEVKAVFGDGAKRVF